MTNLSGDDNWKVFIQGEQGFAEWFDESHLYYLIMASTVHRSHHLIIYWRTDQHVRQHFITIIKTPNEVKSNGTIVSMPQYYGQHQDTWKLFCSFNLILSFAGKCIILGFVWYNFSISNIVYSHRQCEWRVPTAFPRKNRKSSLSSNTSLCFHYYMWH